MPFHELVRGRLGGADLALSDITITDERAEHLDFSTAYLKAPPAIVVRPGTEVADVNAARDLHWAVQHDTTLKAALEESIEPTTQPLVFQHQREVLQALRVGRADAVMLDLPVALAYAHEAPRTYAVRRSCQAKRSSAWHCRRALTGASAEHSPAPPVAVVRGNAGRLGVVRMRLEDEERQAPSIAEEMACRVASGPAQRLDDDHADWSELLAPGDVTFVSSELGDTLGKLPGAADGLVVSTVAEWLIGAKEPPATPRRSCPARRRRSGARRRAPSPTALTLDDDLAGVTAGEQQVECFGAFSRPSAIRNRQPVGTT